jgi:hypothetical protein
MGGNPLGLFSGVALRLKATNKTRETNVVHFSH